MPVYCPHCGAVVREDGLFCPECGGRLRDMGNTALTPEAGEAASGQARVDDEPSRDQGAPEDTQVLTPDLSRLTDVPRDGALVCPPEEGRRRNRTARWIIFGLAAVLCVCLCCLVTVVVLGWLGQAGNL